MMAAERSAFMCVSSAWLPQIAPYADSQQLIGDCLGNRRDGLYLNSIALLMTASRP